jgi:hypothetical protein
VFDGSIREVQGANEEDAVGTTAARPTVISQELAVYRVEMLLMAWCAGGHRVSRVWRAG